LEAMDDKLQMGACPRTTNSTETSTKEPRVQEAVE
ncbi:hypothetical protein T03_455, partial [Trichinella britovi]